MHDLAAWAPALGTGRLLSRATFAQQTKFIAIPGSAARYGLGMFDFEGYYGHNGSLPGYTTFVAFQPRQHRTIVVITNLTTPVSHRLTSWPPSSSSRLPPSRQVTSPRGDGFGQQAGR